MECISDSEQRRGILASTKAVVWWGLLALAGFAWAVFGFVYFAREYSTAPSIPGLEHCYCFSRETWGDILFPSMLHLGLGVIVMVAALVMAARAGKDRRPGGPGHTD